MRYVSTIRVALVSLSVASLSSAVAAQTWIEIDDAGDLPGTAQVVTGSGALTTIVGQLSFNNVDMYEIVLTGGGTFSATAQGLPPIFSLNPQLYLFDATGRGVYANENLSPPDLGPGAARLPANHVLTPLSAGHYFLAVSTYDFEPSGDGGMIFPCVGCSPSLVFGPTGPGGLLPVTGWPGRLSFGGTGGYRVALTGAGFVSADSTPPSIIPTVIGTLGQEGWYTSDVSVSWSVTDPDSAINAQSGCDSANITTDTSSLTFTCVATSAGGTSSASVAIRRDATPPAVSCSANTSILWPPDQHLVPVRTSVTATDAGSGSAGFLLDSFATSEGELASNVVDWTLATEDTEGLLRAYRVGSGGGLTYTLWYVGGDIAGNQTRCEVTVFVPHDRGNR